MPLTAAQVTMFTNWVNAGGNLIAMRPDKQLAVAARADRRRGDARRRLPAGRTPPPRPAPGIVGQTMQFHGTADRYTLNGATPIATLYSNATDGDSNPAVTVRSVGAAAGRPRRSPTTWPGRSSTPARAIRPGPARSATASRRSAPTICSSAAPQPDWVDLTKVAIPQADEQQRLLANLIGFMNRDRKPLPRFWYLPRGEKAVVVMTGDDHANNGTAGRFDIYKSNSPAGCTVDDWECVRGTSYIYPTTPISNAQAAAYAAEGFEIGVHVDDRTAPTTRRIAADDYANRARRVRGHFPERRRADGRTARTASPGATTTRSRRWRWQTASGSTRTTTTGRAVGAGPARVHAPAPACRCGSRRPTAR